MSDTEQGDDFTSMDDHRPRAREQKHVSLGEAARRAQADQWLHPVTPTEDDHRPPTEKWKAKAERIASIAPHHLRSQLASSIAAALAEAAPDEPKGLRHATLIARYLWEKHYKTDAPEWQPADSLVGVLMQIDNMTTGLSRTDEPKGDVRGALRPFALDFSQDLTGDEERLLRHPVWGPHCRTAFRVLFISS